MYTPDDDVDFLHASQGVAERASCGVGRMRRAARMRRRMYNPDFGRFLIFSAKMVKKMDFSKKLLIFSLQKISDKIF